MILTILLKFSRKNKKYFFFDFKMTKQKQLIDNQQVAFVYLIAFFIKKLFILNI